MKWDLSPECTAFFISWSTYLLTIRTQNSNLNVMRASLCIDLGKDPPTYGDMPSPLQPKSFFATISLLVVLSFYQRQRSSHYHCYYAFAFGFGRLSTFSSSSSIIISGRRRGTNNNILKTKTMAAATPLLESSEEEAQFRIGYLSDIEGHWDYFL